MASECSECVSIISCVTIVSNKSCSSFLNYSLQRNRVTKLVWVGYRLLYVVLNKSKVNNKTHVTLLSSLICLTMLQPGEDISTMLLSFTRSLTPSLSMRMQEGVAFLEMMYLNLSPVSSTSTNTSLHSPSTFWNLFTARASKNS